MNKILPCIALSLLFFYTTTFAMSDDNKQEQLEREETIQELTEYKKKQMLPWLSELRARNEKRQAAQQERLELEKEIRESTERIDKLMSDWLCEIDVRNRMREEEQRRINQLTGVVDDLCDYTTEPYPGIFILHRCGGSENNNFRAVDARPTVPVTSDKQCCTIS